VSKNVREDMAELIPFGFYICRAAKHHPLSNIEPNMMISASDCLCDHEPQLSLCHGWEPHGDDADYISRFCSQDEYLKMSEEINSLFSSGAFFGDGRFTRLEDALHFFDSYFQDCILISVSTSPEYLSLNYDLKYYGKDDVSDYEPIGMDILGGDYMGFHSFLCNSLQDECPDIGFNKHGFMETDFKNSASIASKIQGMGEPVDWFPVEVRKIR
jgi:hypothetical protein